MKTTFPKSLAAALVAALFLVPAMATAQIGGIMGRTVGESPEAVEATAKVADEAEDTVTKPAKKLSPWKRYTNWLDSIVADVIDMDLYGTSAQLPRGFASVKWDHTRLKANRRYNDKHQITPLLAPIALPGNVKLDLGLGGEGGGHVFQASYGITDKFNWYFELPYQYMHLAIRPKLLDGDTGKPVTNPNDPTDTDFARREGIKALYKFLPLLGRPVPNMKYDAEWVMSDINTGFSWNPWRTKHLSTHLTCRVFFPTGRVADPNSSLTLGTGPELDTGIGGWAAGFTNGWDLRIYKYSYWIDIQASSEFSMAYGFKQKRKYPTNFETVPNQAILRAFNDPAVFLQFPDLRHLKGLKGGYDYTPGFSMSWMGQLEVQVAILGLGFGYGVSHSQEPEMDGDYYFIQMAKGLQLTGQQTIQAIQLGASISLLPFYIPVDFSFNWRKVVDGYNAIIFDDYWNLIVKTYIPIFR